MILKQFMVYPASTRFPKIVMIELSYQLTSTNNGTFQKIESTVSKDAEEDPETGMENLGNFAAT